MDNKTNNTPAVKGEHTTALVAGNIFLDNDTFELAQRMASALAASTIVPKDYQGKLGNCLIALEMASRLKTSPLMVMQNLYIVNGRPAWSSQYIIAMINNSHKYTTELQFKLTGSGDNLSCYAFAEDYNGHIVKGPEITMALAKKEGWVSRSGSKWQTMPEVMIRYRAASFFGRLNCPDLIMGYHSADEVIDIGENDFSDVTFDTVVADAESEIEDNANQIIIGEDVIDAETGEVKNDTDKEIAEKPADEDEIPQF